MKWKHPPVIKIYEALGAVADGRVKELNNCAQIYSSSGNKYYEVVFDPETSSIMANDNGSYWKGYLGYPSIAFLMKKGVLSYDKDIGKLLKGIQWKDINQKFKNDFDKTIEYIFSSRSKEEIKNLENFADKVMVEIKDIKFNLLGKKALPPEGR